MAALLPGCSDNDPSLSYSYVRSAADFAVDTAEASALCDDPGPWFEDEGGVTAAQRCRNTQKLKLTWERPDDTDGFKGYMLYLDTTPRGREDWKKVQSEDKEAAVSVLERAEKVELIVFLFDRDNPPPGIADRPTPDTLRAGTRHVIGIDTAGRLDSLGRFVFAITTRYGGDKTPGQPLYTWIITGDKDPPSPFAPRIVGRDRRIEIDWARPNDPTSFFNPLLDTGLIAEYKLTVRLSGEDLDGSRGRRFDPVLEYYRGGERREEGIRDSVLKDVQGDVVGRQWVLPDMARAKGGKAVPGPGDSLRVVVRNLVPSEVLDVRIFAKDSAGNDNSRSMSAFTEVRLTDTTRPSAPELEAVDSLTRENSFTVRWSASRDSVDADGDGDLEQGPEPNYRIASYRLSRTLIPRTAADSGLAERRDTLIAVADTGAPVESFRVAMRFLPPGKEYVLRIVAVDVSGFLSHEDTLTVSTRPIRFSGSDSGLACPPGFVPIPRKRFTLGQAGGDQDETGGGAKTMESFCIEPYEHRDSTGGFATKVTWEDAQAACEDISPAHGTTLCTEAQWERACEGFDFANPHPHGIQSEGGDPGILQTKCNQGAGDVAMAMSLEKRNPVCLTNEGVYDMAGNLSEWVRDAYVDSAYRVSLKDSVLGHDDTASAPAGAPRAVRGGNYLVPPLRLTPAGLQALARCSNRDQAMQVRPVFRAECVDERPKIAILYSQSGLSGHRCVDIPEAIRDLSFADVVPRLGDTTGTRLTLFEAGTNKEHHIEIPADTAFRGRRPVETRFTTLSVAEVVFEKVGNAAEAVVDTLDAREMRDTSQATLARILERESPSAAWRPRLKDGRIEIRRLYAYVNLGSKPARAHYASRAIGFRCCARPAPAAPPVLAGP